MLTISHNYAILHLYLAEKLEAYAHSQIDRVPRDVTPSPSHTCVFVKECICARRTSPARGGTKTAAQSVRANPDSTRLMGGYMFFFDFSELLELFKRPKGF
jgi:hypothetical protein